MDQQHGQSAFHLRPALVDDIPFIQSLAPRFAQVGTPAWRDSEQMWQFHQRCTHEVGTAITNPDDLVLIAEDMQERRLGFLHVTTVADFFTGEPQGYVSDVAVSEQAEGKGVARTLIEHAQAWARERGLRILALDVFAFNTHARAFYQGLGFVEETLKLIKEL
ncbi:MAG TPA: GNAT family N-acetyltransferase [Ktedonobacteraceae bacterium]|nr:GNAT family N-acetyltransferase [Ktedonobacteraceae bacterium]